MTTGIIAIIILVLAILGVGFMFYLEISTARDARRAVEAVAERRRRAGTLGRQF